MRQQLFILSECTKCYAVIRHYEPCTRNLRDFWIQTTWKMSIWTQFLFWNVIDSIPNAQDPETSVGPDSIQWPSLFVLLKGTWGSWKPRHWGRTNLHKICKRQRIEQSSRVYGWQDLTVQSVAFNAFSSCMMKKEVQILTWEEFPRSGLWTAN